MAISISASMPVGEKLTPLEELMRERGRFISIREAVGTVKARYPEMTYEQVAEWIYRKARSLGVVEKTFAGITGSAVSTEELFKRIANNGGEVMSGNEYGIKGYYREALEKALNMNLPAMRADYQDDDYTGRQKGNTQGISCGAVTVNEPPAIWENIHGMETAQKMIAGLVIMNAVNDKRFQRKDGINKSAVARLAANGLAKYGGAFNVSDRQLTELISKTLKHVPKLKDAVNGEHS